MENMSEFGASSTHWVTLPEGERAEIRHGTPVREVLSPRLSKRQARELLLARMDGKLVDLAHPVERDCSLEPVFPGDPGTIEIIRHSTAHVMAQAVKELFPGAKVAIGPAIENGFYYDFDYERPFTPEDLVRIEERMREIAKAAYPISREVLGIQKAREIFVSRGEIYKIELIDELSRAGEVEVSLYGQSGFLDLCRGPHVPDTGRLGAFKLTGVAGAYWRGDERNPMLQRIYGVSFLDKKELAAYLERIEEAKRRDHRRIGKDLDLFSIQEEIGPGLILWHPKGAMLRRVIEDFWKDEHIRRGYDLLYTPHIARRDLWKRSGHLDFYAESMYAPMVIDEVSYQIKPMNCPFHIAVYNSRRRSYRELPLRWCELGTVYRYERTGTLHGLMRVRGFTQDDAHVFCRPDHLDTMIHEILELTLFVLRVFGFDRYDIYLSTRPERFVGTEENWERATAALEGALKAEGLAYEIDPGEGVFYGPKIDIKIRDCLDRSWQCSTIQVDFNLPERFDVNYIGEDGHPRQAIMVHRALMGSIERFVGVLIEHYAGAFPFWLAPVQAVVLTVTDRQDAWAVEVQKRLKASGFRVEADLRNEKLGKKIREAQLVKIPYMLVVGDKEMREGRLNPRSRSGDVIGSMTVEECIQLFTRESTQSMGQGRRPA